MPLQDYLKRQIDQLGLVLAKLLSKLLDIKHNSNSALMSEAINDVLTAELSMSIEDISRIEKSVFLDLIQKEKAFNSTNIQLLTDVFFEFALALESGNTLKKMLLEKCLFMEEFLEISEKTYSVERHKKMLMIKELLAAN